MDTVSFPTSRYAAPAKRRQKFGVLRLFAAAIVTSILLGFLASAPAGADPKKGDVLVLVCDTLGSVEIVVFSNGSASPGLVVAGNRVVVPYRLYVEGTFTPNDGGDPQTFIEEFNRPAPRNGRTDHCTFEFAFSDEFGSAVAHGEVSISYTPNR